MGAEYERVTLQGRREYVHRVVMSETLGRTLLSNEHVHHRNGDRRDNRPENLELVEPSEHAKHHGLSWKTSLWSSGKCSKCGCDYDERTRGCNACGQRHRTRLKYGRSGRIVPASQTA
jgi:hypothetical protein